MKEAPSEELLPTLSKSEPQNLLIFKTSIVSGRALKKLSLLLDHLKFIKDWSVDMEDCDRVLRIETDGFQDEDFIIRLLSENEIICEVLPD